MRTETGRLDVQKGSRSPHRNGEGLATGLGWFSIGLGLAEVLAPDQVARFIGVRAGEGTRNVLRTYGFREIGAGIGILSQPRPVGWMWGRVAGDLLDLVTLSSGLTSGESDQTRVLTATAAVVGVTVLDVLCAQKLSSQDGTGEQRRATGPSGKIAAKNDSGEVKKTLIINRPSDEVYRFWRDLEKLPTFMTNLESVQITGEMTSHWKAKGPAGSTFEWDAEITEDQPNSRISWRSVGSSEVHNSGTVRFDRATGDRGTLLTVELQYAPPGGAISATVAKLFGSEPGQRIEQDLRLLKQILETGEIVKSDASIHAGMHQAQPPSRDEITSMRSQVGALVNA